MEVSYQRIIFLLILIVVAIEGSDNQTDELRKKLKKGLFDTMRILVNIIYDYSFLNQQCLVGYISISILHYLIFINSVLARI